MQLKEAKARAEYYTARTEVLADLNKGKSVIYEYAKNKKMSNLIHDSLYPKITAAK